MIMAWQKSAVAEITHKTDSTIEQLGDLAALQGCSESELQRLAALGETTDWFPGSALKVEGRRPDKVQLVLTGRILTTRNGRIVGHAGPGTAVSDVEILSGSSAPESITTVTTTRTLAFRPREFASGLDSCPAFRGLILRSLARRVAGIAGRERHVHA
jgi:CRP-like cAMP-binding protein